MLSTTHHSIRHNQGCDLIAISSAVIGEEMRYHTYPYTLHTMDEVQSTITGLYSARLYAWNSQLMMRFASEKPLNSTPYGLPRSGTTNAR